MLKKKIKQTLAIVLSIMVILCSFSTGVGALSVGNSATLKTEYSNVHYDYGTAWGQLALRWIKSDNTPVYCFEASKETIGSNVTTVKFKDTVAWNELPTKAQEGITRATIYGYPNFTYNSSAKDSQIATQLIIWEFELGKRTNYSTSTANLDKYVTSGMTSSIKKCYQDILTKCANHRTYPNFGTTSVKLTGTGRDNGKTLTDKNAVLSSYDSVTSSSSNIGVSKNGNKLTIWANSATVSGKISFKKSCTTKGTALALTGANQTMLYGSIDDPVSTNISVSISVGNIKITKSSDTGEKSGFQFKITGKNSSYSKTVTTGSDGAATVTGLAPGQYVVEEINLSSKWKVQSSKTITVTGGQTTNVSFANAQKDGGLKIVKTSDNGKVDGFKFKISGFNRDGSEYEKTFTTANGGIITVEGLYPGEYDIEEIELDTAIYRQPESQHITVKPNETTTVKFNNEVRYKYIQIEKTASNDNISGRKLAGCEFEVYADLDGDKELDENEKTPVTTIKGDPTDGTKYKSAALEPGKYLVKETKYPAILVNPPAEDEIYFVDATGDDVFYTVKINNTYRSTDVLIHKTAEDGGRYANGSRHANYKFQIRNTITNASKIVEMTDGTLNIPFYGQAMLEEFFREDIAYVLTEIPNDDDYYCYEDINVRFRVWDGVLQIYNSEKKEYENEPTGTIELYNKLKRGSVTVNKSADDGYLKGFTFELSGITKSGQYISKSGVTDENGQIVFDNLPLGEYSLIEKDIPLRYRGRSNVVATVNVTVDNLNPVANIKNVLKTGSVEIQKKSEDGVVEGFEFVIYDINSLKCYPGGTTEFTTVKTDAEGKVVVSGLPIYDSNNQLIQYAVDEVSSDVRYETQQTYYFTLEAADDSDKTAAENRAYVEKVEFFNELQKSNIVIRKTASDNVIENIGFTVEGDNGYKKEYFTDAEGFITTDELPIYHSDNSKVIYTIYETSTPERYKPLDSQTITLKIGENAVLDFYNDEKTSQVTLIKADSEFETRLSGAEFAIYKDANGNKILDDGEEAIDQLFETDEAGVYISKNLVYGDYLLKETKAPDNYLIDDNYYPFSVRNDGEVISITTENRSVFANEPKRGSVKAVKVDSEFLDNKLSGAVFGVYKDANADGLFDEETDTLVGQMSETSVGVYEYFGLRVGSYFVKEIIPPKGYNLDPNYYPFTLVENGDTALIGTDGTEVFKNVVIKGSVKVTKVDEEYPDSKLTGAKFSIYKDVNENGSFEQAVDELVTNEVPEVEDGVYQLDGLRYGRYFLKETNSPEGFILDETYYPFNITTEGEVFNVENIEGIGLANKPIKGSVELKKVDKENLNNTLSGAVFNIYKDVNGNGAYEQTADSYVGTTREITNGVYRCDDLRYGNYLLKEITPPEGYLLDDNYYSFSIVSHGEIADVSNDNSGSFVNTPIKGSVKVTKVDKEYPDSKLSGAKFSIYKDVNENGKFDESVDTLVSDSVPEVEPGIYKLDNLRYGSYLLKETESPEGFLLDDNYYAFNIVNDREVVDVENIETIGFANAPIKGNVKIVKADSENSDTRLSGAVFALYNDANGNGKYDAQTDKYIGDFTETSTGTYEYRELRYGSYLVKETKAPKGFLLDNEYHPFSIVYNDITVAAFNDDSGLFTDTPIKGSVKVIKVDSENHQSRLSGAEFTVYKDVNNNGVYDADTDIIADKVSSDQNGEYVVGDLRYGNYFIKETKAPEGFLVDSNYYNFSIVDNGKTITVSNCDEGLFENKPIKGSLEVKKVDSETREKLKGAEFTAYKDIDNDGIYDKSVDIEIGKLTENDGVYVLSGLRYGKYFVRETKAPEGFLLDASVYPFNITEDGKVVNVYNFENECFANAPIKGSVRITKVDSKTGDLLTGAEFTLYEDVDSNGKYDAQTDIKLGILDETSTGVYEYGNLRYGRYFVKETKAPEGFLIDNSVYAFDIVEHSKVVTVSNNNNDKFANEPIMGAVEIVKSDSETGEKLIGAKFVVYKDVDGNGKYTENVDVEAGVLVDKNDGRYILDGLRYGKYLVKETIAPLFHVLDNEYYSFKIISNGETVTVSNSNAGEFINEPNRGFVLITKVGKENLDVVLTGAEFTLYKDVDNDGTYTESVDTEVGKFTEVSDGVYGYSRLRFGSYLVKETAAPVGHLIDNNYYPLVVSENGQIVVISNEDAKEVFSNEPIRGTVILKKVDAEFTDITLTGAEFTVYNDVNENGLYDKDIDTLYDTLFESKDEPGVYTIEGIQYGKYVLVETKAPAGYVADKAAYAFDVTENEALINITNSRFGFTNTPIKGSLEITKTDVATGKPLPNAQFIVRDSDGNTIAEGYTDENGVARFDGLRAGKYTYQELNAPDGYKVDEREFPFEIVEDGEVIKAEMTNEPIVETPSDIPSDDVNTGVPAEPVTGLAVMAAVVALIFKKKGKKQK
ncbi:MAG: SpaA isopeptide-forming pilin-related protein [Bacteroidales bacterium]|nr:SpaA isopeptide-forming pilin-related protein [Bacteroidales bacterium]